MAMKWTRPKLDRDDPGSGSSTSQLFEGKKSVKAEIFVREDLQNRVDAVLPDHQGPVTVRIQRRALPHVLIEKYFPTDFQEELIASEVQGLKAKEKSRREKHLRSLFKSKELPVLVVEDFGTTGLNGPINSRIAVKEPDDPLYHPTNALTCFLRRNGRSGKTGKNLGSAGLGRVVYFMGSEISTKFVYTVPTDLHLEKEGKLIARDAVPMFFGQSLQNELEMRVGDEQICHSGYLHLTGADRIDKFATPFGLVPKDAAVAEQARTDFQLTREADQTGCSVIVPFPRASLDPEKLLDVVAAEFALPILAGDLVVEVQRQTVDADSVLELSSDDDVNEANCFLGQVLDADTQTNVSLPVDRLGGPLVASDFDPAALKAAGKRFQDGDLVCVSIQVGFGVGDDAHGKLIVAARKTSDGVKGRALVARKGLVLTGLSDRRYGRPQNACVLMKSDEQGDMDALATLLRKAETPNHDDWIAGEISEDDCVDPKALIERVKTAHKDLVQILTNLDTEEDPSIFSDLLPAGGGRPPPPDIESEPSPFSIAMVGNDIKITVASDIDGSDLELVEGSQWQVLVVLDSVQGSSRARRGFQPGSFDLAEAALKVSGGSAAVESPCSLGITVGDPDDFELHLQGCVFPLWADIRVHIAAIIGDQV
jgi:hypothetical protein